MTKQEIQAEALARAQNPYGSTRNFMDIINGFTGRGIPPDDVRPRENVFTYQAWKALGRQVRKGEHGVKVTTWIPMDITKREAEEARKAETEGRKPKRRSHCRPRTATVFHVSQTDPIA
ncbi:MAG: ArdC family protein [Planctomycetota bacterium]|jgi:hypothetical protein